MAFAKSAVLFIFTMSIWGVSMGTVHWVGGFLGWTTITVGLPLDYKLWAATRNFHVGDVVIFKYNKNFSNVVRVTHQNYNSCNATSPIAFYSSGSDTINLTKPSHYYFICSLPGRCLAGQKVNFEATLPPPHLSSSASVVQLPKSNSVLGEASAPSPDTVESIPGNAPGLKPFDFWLSLVVIAFVVGVTGIGTYDMVEFLV
ncbi:Detected protein of unknown function [Hibiscus syriacus]|uniref:Phytocyanin domain-containing protein n=1 Tax=Hibiscus syriacus TaxID=106335 RepID=A0A6A3BJ40_HIBSY|nr:chemocyanin-like [Hibiscus syriacus]KAE8715428.1 Detected protein of unknown function [Hibiscus syriacus]